MSDVIVVERVDYSSLYYTIGVLKLFKNNNGKCLFYWLKLVRVKVKRPKTHPSMKIVYNTGS